MTGAPITGEFMDPGIPFADLLAYNSAENAHWKRWFAEHAAALDLPCDVAGAGTVRNLLLHIFATELFFANRVLDLPKADYETLPHQSLEELFAITAEAHAKFQDFLSKAAPEEWSAPVSLGFRDFKASQRKMVAQTVLHSVHHRGQLATFLRQQGFKQDWTHDLIASKVMA
jgi:uncharacterized damage-inducible protein DinB